jgi:hypothetical protein
MRIEPTWTRQNRGSGRSLGTYFTVALAGSRALRRHSLFSTASLRCVPNATPATAFMLNGRYDAARTEDLDSALFVPLRTTM